MSFINVHCPHCQLMNRLATVRIDQRPLCVRCNTLLLQSKPIAGAEINLGALINSNLPMLVQFWAPWCNACMNFASRYEALSQEEAEICFVKVDIQAHRQLAEQYDIRTIPTMMLFKEGELVDTLHDALPKKAFKQWLSNAKCKELS